MEDVVRIEVDGTPIAFHGYGHYRDEYVRTADGWHFRSSVETRLRIDPLDYEPPGREDSRRNISGSKLSEYSANPRRPRAPNSLPVASSR